MFANVARRAAQSQARPLARRFSTVPGEHAPNTIKAEQAAFQKGATPYLRGDADPTYLRNAGDGAIFKGLMVATALGWAGAFYFHGRMWVGSK